MIQGRGSEGRCNDNRGGLAKWLARLYGRLPMTSMAISLALGIVVGVFYGLVAFNSPAPPPVALIGLAGIVLGEWLTNLLRS